MFSRTSRLLLLVAVPALLAAACGSSTKSTSLGAQPPATAAPAGGAAAPVTVSTKSTGIGTVLVDSTGLTLYHFDHDVSGTPTCTGTCNNTWPPVIVPTGTTPMGGSGMTGTLAQTARPDGTQQLTWNGMPLYHFVHDAAPGDTNGNGIGGIWHAALVSASAGGTTTTTGGVHY